jgi:hypothetical protein
MAFHARRDVLDQVCAAGQTLGRGRKSSRRERARTRPDERPPPDGDGNPQDEHRDQRRQRPQEDVHDLLHVVQTTESRARAILNLPYRDANVLLARALRRPDLV